MEIGHEKQSRYNRIEICNALTGNRLHSSTLTAAVVRSVKEVFLRPGFGRS